AGTGLDPGPSAHGPLRRGPDRPQAPGVGFARDPGRLPAGDRLGLVRAAGDGVDARRAAGPGPDGVRADVRTAQPAGRPADGRPGLDRRLGGAVAGRRTGAGLAAVAPALERGRALDDRAGVRPGADRGAVAPGGDAAAADRAQRLRLPLGVGDDDHDHLRLLRGADRTRAAR